MIGIGNLMIAIGYRNPLHMLHNKSIGFILNNMDKKEGTEQ